MKKNQLRLFFILVILATIPFYLLGWMLIQGVK